MTPSVGVLPPSWGWLWLRVGVTGKPGSNKKVNYPVRDRNATSQFAPTSRGCRAQTPSRTRPSSSDRCLSPPLLRRVFGILMTFASDLDLVLGVGLWCWVAGLGCWLAGARCDSARAPARSRLRYNLPCCVGSNLQYPFNRSPPASVPSLFPRARRSGTASLSKSVRATR